MKIGIKNNIIITKQMQMNFKKNKNFTLKKETNLQNHI